MIADDIQALTAQLARDPSSLVFLPLAESLRRRGQLDAALTVALQGAATVSSIFGGRLLVRFTHYKRVPLVGLLISIAAGCRVTCGRRRRGTRSTCRASTWSPSPPPRW